MNQDEVPIHISIAIDLMKEGCRVGYQSREARQLDRLLEYYVTPITFKESQRLVSSLNAIEVQLATNHGSNLHFCLFLVKSCLFALILKI